jgi:hypothetical protein
MFGGVLRHIRAGQIITSTDVAVADTEAVHACRDVERRFSPLPVDATAVGREIKYAVWLAPNSG